jgi:hypothetical protein
MHHITIGTAMTCLGGRWPHANSKNGLLSAEKHFCYIKSICQKVNACTLINILWSLCEFSAVV